MKLTNLKLKVLLKLVKATKQRSQTGGYPGYANDTEKEIHHTALEELKKRLS